MKIKYTPEIHVTGHLELDENDLKILNHLLSYNLSEEIYKNVTKKIDKKELDEFFREFRKQISQTIFLFSEDKRKIFGDN